MEIINNGVKTFDDSGYSRIDRWDDEKTAKIAEHYKAILDLLGEKTTQRRVIGYAGSGLKAMQFLTKGYGIELKDILKTAIFREDYKQMVIVKDIELYSMCEHDMIPFYGRAHVAYIPNQHITGLSKIAHVVEAYARRLQVQERLTMQIRDCLQDTLDPMGVAVVIEASHMCMQMRGVQKQNSVTTTSAFTGAFLRDTKTREEYINLISNKLS